MGIAPDALLGSKMIRGALLVAGAILLLNLPAARADGHMATVVTTGDLVTLDWAKCCDCEEAQVKPKGEPCRVALTTAHTLKLHYKQSKWPHNLIKVPTQTDFEECALPLSPTPKGGNGGVNAMDETLTFDKPGTYYYACSVMCTENVEYCHCKKFNHKLIVNVTAASLTASPTTPATTSGS